MARGLNFPMFKTYKYKPESVSHLLEEIKDLAALALDLGYSSLIYNDDDLKEEVLRIENQIDYLIFSVRVHIMLATRNPSDAEYTLPLLDVTHAIDHISNAAADIATKIEPKGRLKHLFRYLLQKVDERVACIRVGSLKNRATTFFIKDLKDIDVIAVERNNKWVIDPPPEMELKNDDLLIIRGDQVSINEIIQSEENPLHEELHFLPEFEPTAVEKRILRTLIFMKNKSELSLDLAFSALLLESKELAEEVEALEQISDYSFVNLANAVLSLPNETDDDKETIFNILLLGQALEEISDAALTIVKPLLSGLEIPQILKKIIDKSDENLFVIRIDQDSNALGKTVQELESELGGIWIQAIRRGSGYIFDPPENLKIEADDVLICRSYRHKKRSVFNFFGEENLIEQNIV